ncbi:hypothetical protein WJX77_009350 [Trebouxia sp. C0004]
MLAYFSACIKASLLPTRACYVPCKHHASATEVDTRFCQGVKHESSASQHHRRTKFELAFLRSGAAVCSTEQAALRIGQQLIQEEQRSQARAATKKAKKQRQKGKRDSDSISAAVQQQQLHIAQSEEEPEHTQHAQQAQHAQHAVQHTAPQLAQQAQQGHDHRQPCTTACAPLLSASVATKPSSSQASSLKQKQEMTTPADSTTEDADAAFVQQLFCCPITKVSLVDPVVAADGHTYERSAAEWLQTQVTSPVTGAMLPHTRLVPNVIIKGAIASQLKH